MSGGIFDDSYYIHSIFLTKEGTSHQKPNPRVKAHVIHVFMMLMGVRSMENKYLEVEKMSKSTIATQAECVVFLPGRASRCVIVTMTFAQATVLCESFVRKVVT